MEFNVGDKAIIISDHFKGMHVKVEDVDNKNKMALVTFPWYYQKWCRFDDLKHMEVEEIRKEG